MSDAKSSLDPGGPPVSLYLPGQLTSNVVTQRLQRDKAKDKYKGQTQRGAKKLQSMGGSKGAWVPGP